MRADALFEAFAFELTNADKILQVDPYLTYKVLREKRVLSVGIELRVIEALQETRLNSIKAESTVYLAPQETRLYKIMVPPIKYRSNVPRVRQDS